ncbi:hypothetical protein A9Q99_00980 [Gammaproteobacteria bacterium 45_16_T64]|nr:hypothetical protein A9Q99_00980 [Gammaproteobacteria bacterium 45_16_T64]
MNIQRAKTMKLIATISAVLAPTLTIATEDRVSDAIGPGDSKSKWVVGGTIGAIENPFLNEDSTEGFVIPNIEYRGERFFAKDGELGLTLLRNNGVSTGILLTGKGSFLSDDDNYDNNEKLAGIEERDPTLNAGFYVMHSSNIGRLKIAALDEITGEHAGMSFDAHYVFDIPLNRWNINPMIGVNWMSAQEVDHFFGVSESEATTDRTAYEGDAATNVYAGVRGRYEITNHWDLNLNAHYIKLGDGITDSSIIEKDEIFVSSIGVNYNF